MRLSAASLLRLSYLLLWLLVGCAWPGELPVPRTSTPAEIVLGDYYLSTTGSDSQDGHSPATAWRTLAKLSATTLHAGNRIYLHAGDTFTGSLTLTGTSLSATQPVLLSTYPLAGRATLLVLTGSGLLLTDFAGIEVEHLNLVGQPGTASAIAVIADKTSPAHIVLRDVEASGFGEYGVALYATGSLGLRDVLVSDCRLHDNLLAGLASWSGAWPAIVHSGIVVENTTAYRNTGNGNTQNNSGSGIMLAGVDGARIEHCTAYENGSRNGHAGGGPMGIWCYDARNVLIQYCESHHNYTSLDADGGGFDLDGGASYCTIQYCYAHDNQGEGYGLFEYGSPNPWTNNTVRFNVSDNDGLKTNNGGLCFWAASGYSLRDSQVYNNTVVGEVGCSFVPSSVSKVLLANNLLATTSSQAVPGDYTDTHNPVGAVPLVNGYHLPTGSPLASGGVPVAGMPTVDFYGQPVGVAIPIGVAATSPL